jgi:hypothetical protein
MSLKNEIANEVFSIQIITILFEESHFIKKTIQQFR